jgi:glycosyltransferase involved in cell wall biosynthesis
MRVLLLHNRYRAVGGEERAVAEIGALLERRGHELHVLERTSDGAGRATAATAMLHGGADPDEVGLAVRRARAEIVHAHNLHPLFGWRALAAAHAVGVHTVLHLHNYRLFCAIAVGYRENAICFRCHGRNTLPGLALRCRGGLGEAAVYAAGLARQQPHLLARADRLVVLSRAQHDRLRALGLPAHPAAELLPNFVGAEHFAPASAAGAGEYALVAGRLVPEKGYDTAIAAAREAGIPLVIAGTGPDEARLRELAAGAEVRFTGWLEPRALDEVRAGAGVVLAPSRWEEPCPYAVLEALAAGVPVLASDCGGLPELVGPGQVVVGGAGVASWADRLSETWRSRARLGAEGLADARERFGEERYYERLLDVYERTAGAV